jgi:predicted  nucleic acid-binding Zn-ribbon protein
VEEQLHLLIELQELDLAITRLRREKEAIPLQIRALEQRQEEEESRLKAIRDNLEELQKKRRSMERELDHQAGEMKKRQGRLLEVKTNREYSAILQEIQVLKDKQSALEDQILELLDLVDQRGREISAQTEKLAQEKQVWEAERRGWEKKLEETERQLALLLHSREEKIRSLDPSWVEVYTRIYEARGGLAVVPVRNRSCSGCFVTLTPQAYEEAVRNDRILTCPNCNRILYGEESGRKPG